MFGSLECLEGCQLIQFQLVAGMPGSLQSTDIPCKLNGHHPAEIFVEDGMLIVYCCYVKRNVIEAGRAGISCTHLLRAGCSEEL